MSVRITSYVPAYAGGTLTDGNLTLIAPNDGAASFTIGSIDGLQAALDAKLDDIAGAVGTTVTATGTDLNTLTGVAAYGLIVADLEKLADITVSAAEVNFLAGVTSNVQAQLDDRPGFADFTADNDIFIATGAGAGGVENFGTVLGEYEFGDLGAPTANLNINGQKIVNSATTLGGDPGSTLTTKDYVDAVAGAGSFLPIDGSAAMTGNLDLDGNSLILDVDGNSAIVPGADAVAINLGGAAEYQFTTSALNLQGNLLSGVADPVGAQDGATKNYVDTTALLLAGGVMAGNIDLNGTTLIIDADGDTSISSAVDDTLVINTGGAARITVTNTGVSFNTLPITGLADPTNPQDGATKNYVDTNTVAADGSTPFTGDIDLGGNSITNVADPTLGSHVGDRDYNDARYLIASNDLSDLPDPDSARTNLGLATVAATGSFTDLINQPSYAMNDLTNVNIGIPGAGQNGYVVRWNNGAGEFDLAPAPVTTVFSRTGAVVATAGDYNATQITFTPVGNIAAVNVQTALAELDSEKLALAGGTMSGALNMNSNNITNVGTLGVNNHSFVAGQYTSILGGNSFHIRTTATPSAATPTYSFASDTTSGIWWNGTQISLSVDGTNRLSIGTNFINASNNRITNVAAPTSAGDAVNLSFLNGLGMVKLLGSETGIDLMAGAGTTVPIYAVPAGVTHIITNIIVIATSYTPGGAPTDAVISLGIGGPNWDQIVSTATLSWGVGGAADQAVYFLPDQGAVTPNSTDIVTLQKDTLAAGTFSSLVVSVYVLGIEV